MISWKEILIKCDLTHPFTRVFFHLYCSGGTLFSQTCCDYLIVKTMFLYVPLCKAGDHFASTQVCENVFLSEQIHCLLIFVSDILSEGHRSVLWDGPAQSRDSSRPRDRLNSLSLCSSRLWFLSVAALWLPADSVDRVAHLVQLQQKAVCNVKCGEANSHCDGSFHPVHAQAFV